MPSFINRAPQESPTFPYEPISKRHLSPGCITVRLLGSRGRLRIILMRFRKAQEDKSLLLDVMGQIVKEKRKALNKGILLLSYEYGIPSSSIAQLEKGKRDVQISTLWKLVNALGMSFPEFIAEVSARLPEGFKLIEY